MKPVLLATDGSPSATEATREAIELAHCLDVPLIAVGVEQVSMSVPAYGYYGFGEVYAELAKTEHEHVLRILDDVAARAEEAGIEYELVPGAGLIVDEICRVARERHARLIVMGAHGWGPLRRLIFGSVSLGVLHEAPCPVLVARAAPELETLHVVDEMATPV